ncbi:MAG: UDP-N-acetylmuramoyl-L-alanyl-D-glutamate--2,6-diaminopimelate ligase [Bacillota bacterium]
MQLSALCDAIGASPSGDMAVEVTHITNNSRDVREGSLFVCIPGLKTDGHNFAAEAINKGAVALIVEKDVPCQCPKLFVPNARVAQAVAGSCLYGNPTSRMELIGVTGTNGKTTTTYMIESILKAARMNTGVIGTINYRYMDKVIPSERTTPDSVQLQKIFRDMLDGGVSAVVMEVSSHALELNRVDGCEFDTVILTNITHDHFDFHKDFNSYLHSKYKLFQITAKIGIKNNKKLAVINADDPYGMSFLEKIPYAAVTFGIDSPADYRAYNITLGPGGCSFDLDVKSSYVTRVNLNMPGKVNIYNALGAIAYSFERGLDIEIIKRGLAALANVPGRFERVNCGQPFDVLVDFAHNPDGLANLLTYCEKRAGSRRIVVFGCEGGKDTTKRSLMGEIAALHADISIITTDNMFSESPEKVAGDIAEGLKKYGKIADMDYFIITDRYQAIKTALELARDGDEVFVAGKGHETSQLYYDKLIPFDDKEVIRAILTRARNFSDLPVTG